MTYTIIEDCSPYYIRFTYPGLDEFIEYVNRVYDNTTYNNNRLFNHVKCDEANSAELLDKVPLTKQLTFNQERVSFFVSKPGLKYPIHKDGISNRWSINYTVRILDDRCVTRWWKDEDMKDHDLHTLTTTVSHSRELYGVDTTKYTPLKTMTAQPGEVILFNTDIFHDWDNSRSLNERVVLTLHEPNPGATYFEDIKQILWPRSSNGRAED